MRSSARWRMAIQDKVRAAYHRGAHWEERVAMAQWWSDHLDQLRKGGDVVRLADRKGGLMTTPEEIDAALASYSNRPRGKGLKNGGWQIDCSLRSRRGWSHTGIGGNSTYPYGGNRKERLPRDTHRQPIPNFIWQYLESVSAALDSKWLDDPEEPDDWAIMDWISGQFETIDFDTQNDERVFVYFHAIAVEAKVARQLLGELAGKPRRRPGRPKGPRDKWERQQARRGF